MGKLYIIGTSTIFLLLLFLLCEYGIYFIVLNQCKWPKLDKNVGEYNNELNAMIIADIHLIGKRKGHWFDKLRREWQMYRTFQTALTLFSPDVVFVLGDLLDEGSFSPNNIYQEYVERFFSLFSVANGTEMIVVAGNHDIGFHYAMDPYLEYRFGKTFNVSSIRLVTKKDVHFVLINSMAMEGDGCYLCSAAEQNIKYLSAQFRCMNGTAPCDAGMKLDSYSKPVLLQHFPLYRVSDAKCSEVDEAPYSEKRRKFRENWDCISKKSTKFLLDKLNPLVVFSGHTHHGCVTVHRKFIKEYSVASFNWRNKPNPSFILARFMPENYAVNRCHVPSEYTIVAVYIIGFISIIFHTVRAVRYYKHNRNLYKEYDKLV